MDDVTHPGLRAELLAMVEKDQELRMKWVSGNDPPSQRFFSQLAELDARHTKRMKEILDESGWPTRSMVGPDGAQAAWLLVQHSPDKNLQRRCLELMRPLVERGEVSAVSVAYLTDRVLVSEGKPQLYGTQFREVDGTMKPFPIDDPKNVNKRRAELGLPTLEEYERQLKRLTKPSRARKEAGGGRGKTTP